MLAPAPALPRRWDWASAGVVEGGLKKRRVFALPSSLLTLFIY